MANHWATRWVNQVENGQRLRLDPCHLPQSVTYIAPQSGISLTCSLAERGILLRAGKALENENILQILSPKQFRGIAAYKSDMRDGQKAISLVLLHKNPDYSVPLLISCNHDDVLLDWRLWADVYDLPMLTIDHNGTVSDVMERSPLDRFISGRPMKTRSDFLLRCRGRSLNVRLVIANQVMLG